MFEIIIIIFLILLAMLLFVTEILTPTFGLLTALGVVTLAGAVFVAFRISSVLGIVLILAFILAVPTYFVLLYRLLPKTSLGAKLFLKRNIEPGGAGTPEAEEQAELLGRIGTAETQLRPSGAIRVDGKRIIALAESGVIEDGAKVKIIRAGGSNVIVRQVEDSE